jgi:hypothetical protein
MYPTGLKRAMIVFTTISAAIMELIDTSIVNVALSQISGNLGATIEEYFVGGYSLCHCQCNYHSNDRFFAAIFWP